MHDETLSLRISKAEARALRERAKREGVSRASLVRQALRAYGVTRESGSEKSAYEVIEPLIGKLAGGPADLSTNPAHLDEYGQ